MDKHFSVAREIEFDYGHRVPNHGSKCRSVHGHRGKVEVTVCGPLVLEGAKAVDEGMVMDFSAIEAILKTEIHDKFDHYNLNDSIVYPTAERLCEYIYNYLISFHLPDGVYLSKIRVWETEGAYVEWAV